MKIYDWIVIGAGITGTALGYELVKAGFQVLLLEKDQVFQGATRYSYGGLAYWSGTTPLTRTLCQEGKARYQELSEELAADIQFREINLLLTVNGDRDPQPLIDGYQKFDTSPKFLAPKQACEVEPLLSPAGISGAFMVPHGHVSPENLNQGYLSSFQRLGGTLEIAQVTEFLQQQDSVIGVRTEQESYFGQNIAVCAGGLTRQLCHQAGIPLRIHFTHTEVLETDPVDLRLKAIVMSAAMERFQLEADATRQELEPLWNLPNHELSPVTIDSGAVQLLDSRIRIGQPSRVLSDPDAQIDARASEALIRQSIGQILPTLADLPARWYHCLVAFSHDSLPLVGAIPQMKGLYVFSGFSNPLVFVPPIAQRFVQAMAGQPDEMLQQLSPRRLIDDQS
ncbi:MAG: NAD(P)/FAD-dependent oxidoreductase [Microcoleaceae cyanobacterium]